MKRPHHLESATAERKILQIGELMADLERAVGVLNGNIAAEEERAKVFDGYRPEYPVIARTLAARRDNLANTIAALRRLLAAIRDAESSEVSV